MTYWQPNFLLLVGHQTMQSVVINGILELIKHYISPSVSLGGFQMWNPMGPFLWFVVSVVSSLFLTCLLISSFFSLDILSEKVSVEIV